MLKAADIYERTHKRIAYDPDGDNFNFGYDMALTLKVRLTMMKLIRKEILANGCRMWELMLD